VGLLRFELKSVTPEATRIPSYPTGPKDNFYFFKINRPIEIVFGKKKIYFKLLSCLANSAYFSSRIFADSTIASFAVNDPSVSSLNV